MNKKNSILVLFWLLFGVTQVLAQENHQIIVNKDTIGLRHYYKLNSILPNRPIQVFLTKELDTIKERSLQKKFESPNQKEYWHQVFLNLSNEKVDVTFLEMCLEELYYHFFFDKNRVHLIVDPSIVVENVNSNTNFLKSLASLWMVSDIFSIDSIIQENRYDLNRDSFTNAIRKSKSKNRHESITLKEMESLRDKKKLFDSFLSLKKRHFITLTNGFFQVGNQNAAPFDEETLVDLRNFNSLWNISYTYMIAERWGLGIEFGFISKKTSETNTVNTGQGISISGSASGGAVVKMGIGAQYIAYKTRRLNIYPEIKLGRLNTTIGGGGGGATITEFGISRTQQSEMRKQATSFLDFKIGANYRLGKVVLLHGNIHTIQSNFEEDIGSISGFSGVGINLGIGFTF